MVLLEEEGPYIVNGKEVKIASNYNTHSKVISVVLTGIPVSGYNQSITVIGYALIDGSYTFVPTVVTRSVAQVALNAAKAGDSSIVDAVLSAVEQNYYKYYIDEFGNLNIDSSIYEFDRVNLRTQFINDWNNYIGTSWIELDATAFFNSAKAGLNDTIGSNKDLSNSNIYKFFNDPVMSVKWGGS